MAALRRDISLRYLRQFFLVFVKINERQKCYGPDKKILFKKQLFDLEVKGQDLTKVITVCDIPPYDHALTNQKESGRSFICVTGINFVSFYDFSIEFWTCSHSVVCFSLNT
jgi:hypothetical protein